MADYWKSNPRHYCEACKCWMGDNKVSIEFHEGGRRHKANVERLLRESRKRASVRDKEAVKLSETLEQIEKAALASYARDQQGLPPSAKRVAMATTGITPTPDMIQFEQQNIKKQMEEKLTKKKKELDEQQALSWQQLTSPEGYPYYYNSITGISQWEPPVPETFGSAHPAATASDVSYQESNQSDQHENIEHENETTVKHENETIVKHENEDEVEHENKSQTYSDTPTTVSIKQEESSTTDNQLITAGASYGAWTTVSVRAQSPATPTEDEEHTSDIDTVSDNEEHTLKEKTLPVLQDTSVKLEPGAFRGFAFKKKQKRSNNIKERTSDW